MDGCVLEVTNKTFDLAIHSGGQKVGWQLSNMDSRIARPCILAMIAATWVLLVE